MDRSSALAAPPAVQGDPLGARAASPPPALAASGPLALRPRPRIATLTGSAMAALVLIAAVPARSQTPLFHALGDGAEDNLGQDLNGAGDIDGDGLADVIAGAPNRMSYGQPGYARVYAPPSGAILYSWTGDAPDDNFGSAVAGGGDLDADGVSDLVVGATQYWTGQPGYARFFSGADGSVIRTLAGDGANDAFGSSTSIVGDLDGDGFDDVLIGASQWFLTAPGYARVYSGWDGSVLWSATGLANGDAFGQSSSRAGDVDGDAVPDFIVGSYPSTTKGAGYAQVFSGSSGALLYTFAGDQEQDSFGFSVSGAGDLQGDGFADLIVGSNPPNSQPGYARAFSGADGSVLYTWVGGEPADSFGRDVAGAGDVDGDQFADVLVGAPTVNGLNSRSGTATIFSGVDGAPLKTLFGAGWHQYFGSSVAGIGDASGDGVPDLAIASSGDNTNGNNAGRIDALSSVCLPVPPVILQPPADQEACVGASSVTFTVGATGALPLGYQWRKDGVPIPGAKASAYTIYTVTAADFGTYDVVVTDCGGSVTSAPAQLTLYVTPPVIVQQPQSQTVCVQAPASFTVGATGEPPLSYQWSKDGVPLPGATSATLVIPAAQPADAGSYQAVVSDCGGSTSSAPASLVVDPGQTPTILVQPQSQTVCLNGTASFSVVATGNAPITYQWRRNGTPIPGATAPAYTIAPAGLSAAGVYDVAVANCAAQTMSAPATLTVLDAWSFYGAPTPGTLCAPTLTTSGCPLAGASVSIHEWNGLGAAAAVLWMGAGRASIPMLGGVLLVQPPLAPIPLPLGGVPGMPCAGAATVPLALPANPSLSGLELDFQAMILDPGAPGGVAMTDGLAMTIG